MIEIISYISVLTSGADDSQIVHEYSMKQYAREPGVIVKMRGGNEDETID